MKQFLVLGLVALVLFALSASLSVWLNRGHTTTEEKAHAEGAAAKKAAPKEPEPGEKGHGPHPAPKHEGPEHPSVADATGLRNREDRLERLQARTELILRDLQAEREAVGALIRQVSVEVKEAAARPPEPEPKAVVPRKDLEAEAAADRKNIEQLARLYDAMPAESAAPILKQMADSGRLDTTVRILGQMKDRQAAQVLAAISASDASLAAQITERLRLTRRSSPPANGVAPAGVAPVGVAPAAAPLPSPVRGVP